MGLSRGTQMTRGAVSLTRRAMLTLFSGTLQQVFHVAVNLVVTPVVVRGLGAELYGAWMMIQQAAGYLIVGNVRPIGTLKLSLGLRQHIEDTADKRRNVGAAIALWAAGTPPMLVVGCTIIWATPWMIRTASNQSTAVQLAMGVTVLAVVVDGILSLPASVLRGVNQDYRAIGVRAAMVVFGGALAAVAIWGGWGLVGLAVATVANSVLAGGLWAWVACRTVPWFGVARPTRGDVRELAALSGWVYLSGIGGVLLRATDVLVLGLVLGPSAAGVYVTTGVAARALRDVVGQALSSGVPGMTGLCGSGEWARLIKARGEAYVFGICAMSALGAPILFVNRAFVSLWIGSEFYAGDGTSALLVLGACGTVLFGVENAIVDALREFRRKIAAVVGTAFMFLVGGAILSVPFGPAGMAVAVGGGYLGLLLYLPLLLARRSGISLGAQCAPLRRPAAVGATLLLVTYLLSSQVGPTTWVGVIAAAGILGASSAGTMWCVGLDQRQRETLRARVRWALDVGTTAKT